MGTKTEVECTNLLITEEEGRTVLHFSISLLYRSYKVIIFVAAKCFICVLSRPIRQILREKRQKTRGLFCLSVSAVAVLLAVVWSPLAENKTN